MSWGEAYYLCDCEVVKGQWVEDLDLGVVRRGHAKLAPKEPKRSIILRYAKFDPHTQNAGVTPRTNKNNMPQGAWVSYHGKWPWGCGEPSTLRPNA